MTGLEQQNCRSRWVDGTAMGEPYHPQDIIFNPQGVLLTNQQKSIIALLLEGKTDSRDIACQLDISPRTVRNHLHNMFVRIEEYAEDHSLGIPRPYNKTQLLLSLLVIGELQLVPQKNRLNINRSLE